MLRKFIKFTRKSLYHKILAYMLFASLVPVSLLSIYTLGEIETVSSLAVTAGKERLKEEVITLQKTNLNNKTYSVEQELRRIEDAVYYLQRTVESLYNREKDFVDLINRPLSLEKDPRGFIWKPYSKAVEEGSSNVFLSSLTPFSAEIQKDINLSLLLEPLFQETTRTNENIVAVYFLTVDSLTRIYPPLNYSDLIHRNKLSADMDAHEYPFFYSADPVHNPEKEVIWTDSYFDVTDRGWMITSLAPVYLEDGTFKGVIGADITFEKLAQNILNTNFEQPGAYAFLVNSNGKLIGIPPEATADFWSDENQQEQYERNFRLSVENEALKRTLEKMVSGEEGNTVLKLSGQQKYFLFEPLSDNGWSLAFVIPTDEIVAPTETATSEIIKDQISYISFKLIIAGLLFILAVIIYSFLISHKIVKPINKLIEGSQKLTASQGEYNVRIPVDSDDEIGILANSFNEMACNLEELIFALKEETRKQLELNKKLQGFNKELEEKVTKRTSDLQQKNEELQAAYKQLQKVEQARRMLIADISHDISAPLTSVLGYVDALREGIADTLEKRAHYLNIIYNQTNEIHKLLEDLFLLSELEARQEINLRPISGRKLVEAWIQVIIPEVESSNLKLKHHVANNLPKISADPDRLKRVFNNIIHNAIEYTPDGGEISIKAVRTAEGNLQVDISDNGKGIAASVLPHIFKRSYKAGKKERNSGKGAGLGLAIANEIIKAHSGKISVQSKPGMGSIFSIQIPGEEKNCSEEEWAN